MILCDRGSKLDIMKKNYLFDRLRSEIQDDRVIKAMEQVQRESFISSQYQKLAYQDSPLPIAKGQTISQPFIIALMISSLGINKFDKVLELGTGSGYQTAILSNLAKTVISIERIKVLANNARKKLCKLGYLNIEVFESIDTIGWPDQAPYDAIIVSAAAPKIPMKLIDQLGDRGRMIIPVGSMDTQELIKIVVKGNSYSTKNLGSCRFVPLLGPDAWPVTSVFQQ